MVIGLIVANISIKIQGIIRDYYGWASRIIVLSSAVGILMCTKDITLLQIDTLNGSKSFGYNFFLQNMLTL